MLTDGPAAGRVLEVEPGPHGMPNLIDVLVPKPDPGYDPEAFTHERYGRMWCPTRGSERPVQYHHLPAADLPALGQRAGRSAAGSTA